MNIELSNNTAIDTKVCAYMLSTFDGVKLPLIEGRNQIEWNKSSLYFFNLHIPIKMFNMHLIVPYLDIKMIMNT